MTTAQIASGLGVEGEDECIAYLSRSPLSPTVTPEEA